jgi:lysozyme
MAKRSTKKGSKMVVSIAIVVLFVTSYWLVAKRFNLFGNDGDVTFVRYQAFGIKMPTSFSIHGIDVSHYQNSINWQLVKQMKVDKIKVGFAFIKATEGTSVVDDMYSRNWKKSKEAGVIRGAYHFFIPNRSGEAQAKNFIETVTLKPGDLPPVLDVETLNGTNTESLRTNVKQWLKIVEKHYRIRPIIYSGVDFYERHLGPQFDEYPLWAAHYQQQTEPRISRKWHIWQHNERGRVSGINTPVDFNAFNGDSTEFKQLLLQ